MEIQNRKAHFDYYIEKELETGIELRGTEIKSLRNGSGNIKDSFAIVKNGELFLLNMFIAKYEEGNRFNHDERRTRKLLAHKKEILELSNYVAMDGYSLIPLKVYLKKNKVKVLLGICKGKKTYDKRQTIKERDLERESRRYASI